MTKHNHSLNSHQQDAVDTIHGPLLVLAGAGSGKTRVVTYRIANLLSHGVAPSDILGLTFTNKAAGEMKERVHSLTNERVLICTFHSLGARILRESITLLNYTRNFTIYDDQDTTKLIKICLDETPDAPKIDAKVILNYISSCKNALLNAEDEINGASQAELMLHEIYRKYQLKLRMCNALDFDDLLYLPIRLFREHQSALDFYQKRWSFLLIDEYQDTNAAQYAMIKYLIAKHNNLCVVGDPDQSIYSWRGANVGNILGFEKDFPGAKVIRLEQNYRSRATILEAANALISYNTERLEKHLWSDLGPGEKIKLFTADTERGEADFVTEQIYEYHKKYKLPLSQVAVFYRTNAQSRALEDRFLINSIPYVIVGGVSFYQRREIKDILAFLRIVVSGVDVVAFSRTINIPKRGIGEATIDKIRVNSDMEKISLIDYCANLTSDKSLQHPLKATLKQKQALKDYIEIIMELRALCQTASLQDLIKATIVLTKYLDYLETDKETSQERKENLNALIAKASEWELSTETPTLEGFLEELSLKSTLDETTHSNDRVNLMTIHNGKGLEFELVFLVGMEEDLFPHANSRDNDLAIEEERRLCYVGMTRAKEYLFICDVRQRFLWGTTRLQRPSRFLKEIPRHSIEKIQASYYRRY